MSVNLDNTMTRFNSAGIDINADFYTLSSSQVEIVLECAKLDNYRKPPHANGSKARYYFAAVQRKYQQRGK